MNGLGACWGSNPEWNRMHCIHVLSHNLPLQIIKFCLIGGGPPRQNDYIMLHKHMPWESTWFIFSCNPIVHSSLSNRNTVCRNDKSLTNEFRRSVAHIIRLKDPQKSPKKNHLLPGSTNMINCKSDCCNSSVMIIWQKYPLTLEPWWVDPLTKHLSSFHLHHLHHKHMALSLSLSCDTHFWTRHVGIFKVAIPTEACRINQEAMVFSGEVDDCDVEYCSNTFSVSFCSGIHLFGPTNFTANGRKKKNTLKEISKGHLARSPHGRWRSPGIAKNHQCSTLRSACACILSLQLNFLSCHVHTSALLQ